MITKLSCLIGLLMILNPVAAKAGVAEKAALESQKQCQNFVRKDGAGFYLGFGPYLNGFPTGGPRPKIPGRLRVVPISDPSGAFDLSTEDGAVDAVAEGGRIFVLTYTDLEEWDLASRSRLASYPTIQRDRELRYREHATAMALYHGRLFITHGRLGLTIFDLGSRSLVAEIPLARSQLPLESQARDISISGGQGYIAMDSFSMVENGAPAFRGVAVVNLDAQSVEAELPGLDPGAESIQASEGKLWIGFDGPLWTFTTSLKPVSQPIYAYPGGGHPIGKGSIEGDAFYSCMIQPSGTGHGHGRLVPRALSLEALQP